MNEARIAGSWKQLKGRLMEQWGELVEDEAMVVAGRREQLAGRIQVRYGLALEEAERQLLAWQRKATDAWFPHDEGRG